MFSWEPHWPAMAVTGAAAQEVSLGRFFGACEDGGHGHDHEHRRGLHHPVDHQRGRCGTRRDHRQHPADRLGQLLRPDRRGLCRRRAAGHPRHAPPPRAAIRGPGRAGRAVGRPRGRRHRRVGLGARSIGRRQPQWRHLRRSDGFPRQPLAREHGDHGGSRPRERRWQPDPADLARGASGTRRHGRGRHGP